MSTEDVTAIFCLFLVVQARHVNSQAYRDAPIDSKVKLTIACENDVETMSCSRNTTIAVRSFFYGRQKDKKHICNPKGIEQAPCEMTGTVKKEKFNLLKKACNGLTQCEIIASSLTFGDRRDCPRVDKYLNIIYTCVPPTPKSTEGPSTTKEPEYYTGTSRKESSTTPTPEPYISLHPLDEDGKEWPKPRLVVKCNDTTKDSDSYTGEVFVSRNSVSALTQRVCVAMVIVVCLLLVK